ncbi:MAG: isochorismate synthase [Actinobacteria bacterium]|uniref:isochorismate synthase n=1 Tax=freshwater metagenome TaxID=449393 RepID=A0A6J5ZUQ8_9ZZZZ|nr:isochorismate synthase [Actinomycetota bacterium]
MTDTRFKAGGEYALTGGDRERLLAHVESAVKRVRRGRETEVLASITVALAPGTDPTAVVAASRGATEPWFAFEQPERDGAALAGLGAAKSFESSGGERFAALAKEWSVLSRSAFSDAVDGPQGSGPVVVGGFAFADDGCRAPHWKDFAPASLQLPELSICRQGDDVRMTLSAVVGADDDSEAVVERLALRADGLVHRPLPLLDPDPAEHNRVVGTMPPEHYEAAVAGAVKRIAAGELEKIVLAREVQVHSATRFQADAVFGVLRDAFAGCHVFAVGRGEQTFIAASPELLVRCEGTRAATLALAGSTRRSADPAVDDHLGEQLLRSSKDRAEQEIVARRIVQTLQPLSVWVTAAEEPVVAKMANIQHLATPIRAQLREPVNAIELAGLLHPTPAVGGEPHSVAAPLIPALEGLDRGWYAGPVGWADLNGDGEFCVALRCALLGGSVARCYAGVGVVEGSDPAAELAETEVKLAALLPVIAA